MNIVTTHEQLNEMVAYYLAQPAFAFDVETVGPRRGMPVVNEILWISFAAHGRCDVIPMGHPNGDLADVVYPLTSAGQKRREKGLPPKPSDYSKSDKNATKVFGSPPPQLFPAEVFKVLEPLMFNESILTVGHNLIFDLCSVSKYFQNRIPSGPYFDTMIGSFLYDNRNKNKCGLDDCLKREFGYEMVKGVGKEVEKYTFNEVAKYAYLDAKYTFLLWKVVQQKVTDAEVQVVMDLEMDVLRVLCDMKLTGAPVDMEALNELDARLKEDVEEARSAIFALAKKPFNINSNADKQMILFGPKDEGNRGLTPKILTIKGQKKLDEGQKPEFSEYSVSAEALEVWRGKDELVDSLLHYSELNKLNTAYVIPYKGGEVVRTVMGKEKREMKESLLINGRVYCDFIQNGAETGRFSSRNPNLQNVPAPNTEHGRAIRNLFAAPEGHCLVVADYSQIEPRIIASFSQDEVMMNNYLSGGDIYTTVGEVMGVDRKAGKVLVLSMAYGVGPDKIARQIGCSVKEAKDLLSGFSDKFPTVNRYKTMVVGAAKSSKNRVPCVKTILGRKRFLPELLSRDIGLRSQAERQAFNTRIQGSAADIIKIAMVSAHTLIPKDARLLLTVHDELVTLCPTDMAEETAEAIRAAMEGVNVLKVPLIADVKTVKRWGEAK
jgi:DNA polymerase I-like protein with 3'-5' exonuclease and polymerase domains